MFFLCNFLQSLFVTLKRLVIFILLVKLNKGVCVCFIVNFGEEELMYLVVGSFDCPNNVAVQSFMISFPSFTELIINQLNLHIICHRESFVKF